MASISSRASGFWSEPRMSSNYFPVDEDDVEQNVVDDLNDTRTPLDKTIDRIGMGSYQWTLVSLCGFGWMADNMWLQAVAIILPRVQQHYSVPDSYIGAVSSSMFAGMMFGAVGWGACSDLIGRSAAFNATLFFTSVFGLLASLANSFPVLCVLLFLLGSAVGGSMPTDGTLLLEHLPGGKEYLVTALSVFFSFGAVLAAVVALMVVPQHSCPAAPLPCDIDTQNQGWKILLTCLGLITLTMFLARMVFFRLHESPRYLVHAGRHQEAMESLQMISRFNGSNLPIALEDVQDNRQRDSEADASVTQPFLKPGNEAIFDVDAEEAERPALLSQSSAQILNDQSVTRLDYSSIGDSEPVVVTKPLPSPSTSAVEIPAEPRRSSSTYEKKFCSLLPRFIRRPLWAWWDRLMMVLAPEWLRITLLVWVSWCAMSLAYTMFNVFLPKLLETGSRAGDVLTPKTLEESLWDVVIFTIGGCPGAILGAWMVDISWLGRRWSLAGSTFVTAIFCTVFVSVEAAWAVRATTVGISLSATTMWAVLYGWTPEIFGTKVRGTACGMASALSRIGGMVAPLAGGMLLMINRSVPVYTSVVIFAIAGVCVLFLKEEDGDRRHGRPKAVIH
ncbi:major facilitator superfamily domain-containing protein [Mycena floridula]|nr:major facilitator superfamily domain-containing protein [Mycena floridula]